MPSALPNQPSLPLSATPGQAERARHSISLIFLLNGLLFATWAVNIPGVRDHLHLSAAQIGLALLAVGIGSLLTMPLTGHWIARWGSDRVTRLLVVLTLLSLALPFLMPDLSTLIAALVLLGALNGSLDVAMNAQGVTVEKTLGRPIMSRLHAYFSLGGVVGALLGTLLVGRVAILTHVSAVVGIGTLLALWAGRALIPDLAASEASGPQETSGRLNPLVLLLGLLCALGMLSEGANYDWASLYFRDVLHLPGGPAGIGYAAFVAAMTTGRWLGDRLRTQLGDQQIVRVGSAVTAAGMALVLLVPHPVTATLGFALSGLGLSNVVPVMYGTAGHALHGKGIAQVATLGYGGFLLGPPAIGFVADAFGLRAALGIALLGAVLVALLSGAAFRMVRPTSQPG
ncbi:MFS transporter [Deinococcus cavernae]|uniref:MFS transporter n=1 Tax=Deinococcus cavernae TaxID=2320857 RepID=A0A418V7U0_9DEIO|nr:MFS transporter [Deinococcus cavernae]RJF72172.1 MFS transporter [Deinococcus cavernae]